MDSGGDTPLAARTGQDIPDLSVRISALLGRGMRAGLPPDIADMYRDAARRIGRRDTCGFFILAAINAFLNTGFYFFMFPQWMWGMCISSGLLISVVLLVAAWLFRVDRLTRFEPLIAIFPCLLTILLVGTASLMSGDPALLERLMGDCMAMVMSATIFLFIDTKYSCWLGGLALLILSDFVIASKISLISEKVQIIFFYTSVELGLLWGRYVLNLYRIRLFLLTTRDKLRNAAAQRDNAILAREAFTDPLTNVANRRAFNAAISGLIESRRQLRGLSLCMIDIDHFKQLNDSAGHLQGDLALRAVADAITGQMRGSDLLARFGGDEFSLLLADIDANEALEIAERIRAAVSQLEMPAKITVSIGVATVLGRQVTIDDLIAEADGALYRAKKAGRNRVSV